MVGRATRARAGTGDVADAQKMLSAPHHVLRYLRRAQQVPALHSELHRKQIPSRPPGFPAPLPAAPRCSLARSSSPAEPSCPYRWFVCTPGAGKGPYHHPGPSCRPGQPDLLAHKMRGSCTATPDFPSPPDGSLLKGYIIKYKYKYIRNMTHNQTIRYTFFFFALFLYKIIIPA